MDSREQINKPISYDYMVFGAVLFVLFNLLSGVSIWFNLAVSILLSIIASIGIILFLVGVIRTFNNVYYFINIHNDIITVTPTTNQKVISNSIQNNCANVVCGECRSPKVSAYKDSANNTYYHCHECHWESI